MSDFTGNTTILAIILSVLENEINSKSCKSNLRGNPSVLENFLAFDSSAGVTYDKYLADIDELLNECAVITDDKAYTHTRETISVFINLLLDGIAKISENSCEMKWRAMMISDYAHSGNKNKFRAEVEQLVFRELIGAKLCENEYERYASGKGSEQEYSAAANGAREKIIKLARERSGNLRGVAETILKKSGIVSCVKANINAKESKQKKYNKTVTNQNAPQNIVEKNNRHTETPAQNTLEKRVFKDNEFFKMVQIDFRQEFGVGGAKQINVSLTHVLAESSHKVVLNEIVVLGFDRDDISYLPVGKCVSDKCITLSWKIKKECEISSLKIIYIIDDKNELEVQYDLINKTELSYACHKARKWKKPIDKKTKKSKSKKSDPNLETTSVSKKDAIIKQVEKPNKETKTNSPRKSLQNLKTSSISKKNVTIKNIGTPQIIFKNNTIQRIQAVLKFEGSGKKIDVKILSAQIRDNYGKEMTLYAKCSSINKKKECTVNCIPQQTLSHSYIQRGEVIINFKYAVNNNWQDCKNFKMRIDYSRTTTGEICSNQIMNIPQIYIPSCTYLPPSSLSPSKVRRSQPTFRQSYYK